MPAWQPMSPGTKDESTLSPGTSSQEKRHRRRQSEPVGSDSNGKPPSVRGGTGQHEDDLDLWQTTSPFASLARGLGGGLSQGLRVKEDRKKTRSVMIAESKGQ